MKIVEVDELIIGAGLAGLTFGNTSISDDYSVAIAEMHFKAGGYATNFRRIKNTVAFDCSQHKITGLGENGNLRNALQRAGLWDKLQFRYFDELTTVCIKGQKIDLPADSAGIKATLLRYFPSQKEGIEKLFEDIQTHGYQNYMFARMLLGEYEINRYLLTDGRKLSNITTREYFNRLFNDPIIIEVMSSIAIYLGAVAHEANAFYFLHYLYAAFETKAGYVEGTSQVLADTLANAFKERGGQIFYRNPILSIDVKGDRIMAVNAQKCTFLTHKIVATCSPHILMKMLPQDCIPDSFQESLDNLKIGWGHISVYLILDQAPELLGLDKSEYLLVNHLGDNLNEKQLNDDTRYQQFTLSVTNYHLLDAQSGFAVQLTILDHKGQWFDLDKDAYLIEKKRIENLLIERALNTFPDMEGHIVFKETSTPRTNFRYTNSPEGSAFGYKVLPRENTRFLYNPPIQGLKFVGGWSTGPGYETSMCLGFTHAMLEKRKRVEELVV
ncbi:phytoene dehydrogenase-like protein [Arcicella aurantiaca]|uniref:Phytoene dehydrogenase-like protein n=1 Tax=Arcicella aurantiaca TaxID=591202 RepID=A0A316DHF6_9BACT|nr:NAD(P)-binding protein [Arcicella aurantiaca]PWK17611.1 phytoene dehydrogenase-like protein [Arcicella aurantiaca]